MAMSTFCADIMVWKGSLGDKYIILWKAEELIFNRKYEVDNTHPAFSCLARAAGAKGMGFDTLAAAVPIVRVPFIGMDPRHARVVARDFAGLFATFVECSGGNVGQSHRSLPKGVEFVRDHS